MKNYYVYVYCDPRKKGDFNYQSFHFDFQPFYVGMGKGERYLSHIKKRNKQIRQNENPRKVYTIRKIIDIGLFPIILKLYSELSKEEAIKKEIETIQIIGKIKNSGPLLNIHDGGNGGRQPEEIIKKISESVKNYYKNKSGPNKGRTFSVFVKEKQRNAKLNKKCPNYPENRKGHSVSEETKQKLHETHTSKKLIKLHQDITKKSWQNPEIREQRIKKISETYQKKRESGKKRIWINNGKKQGSYDEDKAKELLLIGWIKGRLSGGRPKGYVTPEATKQKMRDSAQKRIREQNKEPNKEEDTN